MFGHTPFWRHLRMPVLLSCGAAWLSVAWASSHNAASNAKRSQLPRGTSKETKPSESFRDYRRWQCVNPQPFWVPAPTAVACAAPRMGNQAPGSPHEGKYIRVYVNAIGRRAMMEKKVPRFPLGSVIVKEKLRTKDSRAAELLTVMVKRKAGFNAQNGDWEFLVLNGKGTKIQQRGHLSNCQSCHNPQQPNDYIFRNYLPDAVQHKLG